MEKLSKDVLQKTDELVNIILSSKEYKRYVSIKEQLHNNKELNNKINEIRKLQKHIVKNGLENTDEDKFLQEKIKELENIPIYNEYLNAIDEVNNYLKPLGILQEYFDKLTK